MKEQNAYHTDFEKEQQAKDIAKKSVGEIIREHRTKKGLTQDTLAAALYVTPQAISRWETGQTAPDINLLIPLAQLLDMSVDQLLGGNRRQEFERRFHRTFGLNEQITLLVCEDALREFPNDETFLYRRACSEYFIATQTKARMYLDRAATHFWQLHEKYPEEQSYITFLAQCYAHRGQRDLAKEYVRKLKDRDVADHILISNVLEGEERVQLLQQRLHKRTFQLYQTLLEYGTPQAITAAHSLLDAMVGEPLCTPAVSTLYLTEAGFAADAGDMEAYEQKLRLAYQSAVACDDRLSRGEGYSHPLRDHLSVEYESVHPTAIHHLLCTVLNTPSLAPPAATKQLLVEKELDCRCLLKSDWKQYFRFCDDHVCLGNYFKCSDGWDMTEEECTELFKRLATNDPRYPGNAEACRTETNRAHIERLISHGIMTGSVAFRHSDPTRDESLLFGYCNWGAKEKYKGLPDNWKAFPDPEGSRVIAIMDLFIPKNFEHCGLEQKLLTHAMKTAKFRGFTHAQAYLWEASFYDGIGTFEDMLGIYRGMGFTLYADLTADRGKLYVLQKEL